MKQKIFAIFVLMLFIFSAMSVIAFADNETNETGDNLSSNETIDNQTDDSTDNVTEPETNGNSKGKGNGKEKEDKNQRSEKGKSNQNFVLNKVDKIINTLEKIKAKVESTEDLSEEEKAEIVSSIDKEIAAIEAAKDTLENSEDDEAIKVATETIKNAWKKTQKAMKRNVNRLIGAKIGGILNKIDKLEIKLDRILERLGEPADLEALNSEFQSHIDAAEASFESARTAFASGEMQEMTDYLREAHSHLKEAHFVLRDLVTGIRGEGGDLDDEVEEEDEEEENETEEANETEE